MSITIVGSVAFDTLHSHEGTRERILGGSAVYAGIAASNYAPSSIIGVVGKDFPNDYLDLLKSRKINIQDIQVLEGKTFHWTGSYLEDLNKAKTISTEIGVLGNFHPALTRDTSNSCFLFLANNDPDILLEAIHQSRCKYIALDTMNLWIETKRDLLLQALQYADIFFINDGEIRLLKDNMNIIKTSAWMFENFQNLKYLIVKKGEYGATIFGRKPDEYFTIGAYPLHLVKDPTGAGDTFAGSFLGYICKKGSFDWATMKEALLVGTVNASFTVEEFGLDKLLSISVNDIEKRMDLLKKYSTL
ncbi:MAG: PfkB family carbohydrate kinase [Candidatus Margulisbacteria bacterium]|nr:PfkB family carbohydrate kinase [Candidatus Margulisiibacteriota bacterium]